MMLRVRVLGAILLLELFLGRAMAQECEAVLGYAREVSRTDSALAAKSNFQRYFCDRSYFSEEQAKSGSAGVGLTVPIENLPVSFDGHQKNDSSSWSVYKRSICESLQSSGEIDSRLKTVVESTNAVVINAWAQCINSDGIKFWVDVDSEDPYTVVLVAKYATKIPPFSTPLTKIGDPLTINPPRSLDCNKDDLKRLKREGDLKPGESRVSCIRRNEGNIYVTLHTRDSKSLRLAPIGVRNCSGSDEIVEAVYANMMPPGLPISEKARVAWMALLRSSGSIKSLMKQMIRYNLYKDWIVGASLGANQGKLVESYSWMANAIYYTLIGRLTKGALGVHGLPAEAEAFVAGMPEQCINAESKATDECLQRFVARAEALLNSSDWTALYNGNIVPVFDNHKEQRNILRGIKYCRAISECKAEEKWCQ